MTRTLILMAAAVLAFAGGAHATEQYGTQFGGGGGTEFEQICQTGSMSGMRVRAGRLIDAAGTRCYKDNPINSEMYGGPGGSLVSSDCPGSLPGGTPFVKGIRGRTGRTVDRLGLLCTNATKISSTGIAQFGGTGGTAFSYSCGDGFSAKGFHGASGRLVDRIGVVCSNRAETSSGL
jgi:hypothetical protein